MRAILMVGLLSLNLCINAQNGIEYTNFNLLKVDNTIRIDFTLNAGTTCNGIVIERSADSLFFYEVGNFPGSCGSPTEPRPFSFTDENPILNSINYYRINFGGADYSEILSINYIQSVSNAIIIFPNPCIDFTNIYLENKLSELRLFYLFNSVGQIKKETLTQNDKTLLDLNGLSPGIYVLKAYDLNSMSLIDSELIIIQ